MPTPRVRLATLLATVLLAAAGTSAIAQLRPSALPDFGGLWRLREQGSDSPTQVSAMLRAELRREQSPMVAPAGASSSGSTPQQGGHYGHGGGRGGMGGGGMGGDHMGGGLGGSHGHGGGRQASATSSDASGSNELLKPPPMLDHDSVLVVQQDGGSVQARLDNGEQLAVRLDGHRLQTLDGNATSQREDSSADLQFRLSFGDGSRIDETWSRSADGGSLRVTERWQPGFLQRPVMFRRSYERIDH